VLSVLIASLFSIPRCERPEMDILCPGCNIKSKSLHETSPCTLIHPTTPPRPIMMLIILTSAKDGIGDGQLDFESLREDVAQNFLPWKDRRTKIEKAVPWLTATVSTVAGFVPFGFALRGVTKPISQGAIAGVSATGSAFAGGALAEIAGDPAIRPMLVAFIFVLVFALVWVIRD